MNPESQLYNEGHDVMQEGSVMSKRKAQLKEGGETFQISQCLNLRRRVAANADTERDAEKVM